MHMKLLGLCTDNNRIINTNRATCPYPQTPGRVCCREGNKNVEHWIDYNSTIYKYYSINNPTFMV